QGCHLDALVLGILGEERQVLVGETDGHALGAAVFGLVVAHAGLSEGGKRAASLLPSPAAHDLSKISDRHTRVPSPKKSNARSGSPARNPDQSGSAPKRQHQSSRQRREAAMDRKNQK